VAFFRSLGGTIGVAVLGAVLASRVADKIAAGLAEAGVRASAGSGSGTLDLAGMPPAIAAIVRTAYADATGRIFLIAAGVALLTLVTVALMPATELRTTIRKVEEESAELEDVAA
jgi:hypothetical protein